MNCKMILLFASLLCSTGTHAIMQRNELTRVLVHPEPLHGQTVRASNNFTIPVPPGVRIVNLEVIPAYAAGDWRHVSFSIYRDLRFRWDERVFSNIRFSRRHLRARLATGNLYVGAVRHAPGPFWVVVRPVY